MELAKVYEIENPEHGMWHLNFPLTIGKYRFLAQGISKDPIQFTDHFVYEDEDESWEPLILDQPIKGKFLSFRDFKEIQNHIGTTFLNGEFLTFIRNL